MRHFKSGQFPPREELPKTLRPFSPTEALHHLEDVDLEALAAAGKKLVLLDVDNTLIPWKASEIPPQTHAWLDRARNLGLKLCIISNTRNPARLARLCDDMKIPFIRAKFKPSREMFRKALDNFQVSADQAVMVGDQLLTDIWGANRTGIDAIWVKPLSKREFLGTRVLSRNVERVIGRLLYRYFQAEGADAESRPGFFRHEVVQQLLKFALVGGVATAVDLGLHYYLMFVARTADGAMLKDVVGTQVIKTLNLNWPLDDKHIKDAAFPALKIGPVLLAILVSYLLNRVFTFKAAHQKITAKQVAQFYTVALVGMVISVTVSTVGNRLADLTPLLNWAAGSLLGMAAGFIWNFTGQRLWTFRKTRPTP